MRFRDIAAFVLQHATFPNPTSIVSSKFPHVPLGVGGWPLGYEERSEQWLIGRAISFQDFQPTGYVLLIHQGHRQATCDPQDRALHYSASRGKN